VIEAIFTGILLGVLSGLIPGIHNNTFAALLVSYLHILSALFKPEEIAVVIFTNAVTHTFIDIVPSVFIGVPDEDMAISILPAHEMVLDGRGFQAVSISAFSSLISFLFAIPVFFLFTILLPFSGKYLETITPYFLIAVIVFIIMSEKGEIYAGEFSVWLKRGLALTIFLLSGVTGYFAFLNSFYADMRPGSTVLIPLLLGFFAIPVVVSSLRSDSIIPKQKMKLSFPEIPHVIPGAFCGALVSLFPGVSSGIAAAIATSRIKKAEVFISTISGANTSNALLCFSVLFALGYARSGSAQAFRSIIGFLLDFNEVINLLIIGMITALVAFTLTIILGCLFSKTVEKAGFISSLSRVVLIFIIIYTWWMTGLFGLIILTTSSMIGMIAVRIKVKRINCMGCIILPVLILKL